MTPKPRKKRGANATPEAKALRVQKLRETAPDSQLVVTMVDKNPDRPLTEKQWAFVRYWAQGETILTASYKAGYADSGTMAYRMARDPAILKIYNTEKALYAESCQITRKQVMEGFLEAAEMAKMLSDPVALTGAWREVGKMCGFYEPVKRTIDVNMKGELTVKRLERASDDELLKIIRGEVEDVVFREAEDDDA